MTIRTSHRFAELLRYVELERQLLVLAFVAHNNQPLLADGELPQQRALVELAAPAHDDILRLS
jgi:hypothetical protein